MMRRGRHWSDREGWDDRGGRGRGRGGGRRGMFDNAELQIVLLHLIAEKPRHGYELIRAIEDLTKGAYAPSPGIAYPTLSLLEDRGFVTETESDGARRVFAITVAGRAHLATHAKDTAALLERLGAAATVQERTDAAPVRRAMQNLRNALVEKLAAELPRDKVLDIAAVIDEAAQKIERL